MACGGGLSPVSMIAGAGLMSNVGLGVAPGLTGAIGNFSSLPITSQFSNVVTGASGVLGGGTLDSLRTLGAGTFPALTNAIPGDFAGALGSLAPGGMFDGGFSGLVGGVADGIMGGGDLSKFGQIFNSAQGFSGLANQFINSNLNVGGLGETFGALTGGMDNLMTGSLSQVTEAFGSFGADLGNLGSLINMENLPSLGNPAALVQQLTNVGGLVPGVENILKEAGLGSTALANLAGGGILPNITESTNKLLYEGMTKITGNELDQVKSILGVKTAGISNMADLLDVKKILPTSFPSLTMPTPDGLRGIFDPGTQGVNTNLVKFLSDPRAPQTISGDLINTARQGLGAVTQAQGSVAGLQNLTSSFSRLI